MKVKSVNDGPLVPPWVRTVKEDAAQEEWLRTSAICCVGHAPGNYDWLCGYNSLVDAVNRQLGYEMARKLKPEDFTPEAVANWAMDLCPEDEKGYDEPYQSDWIVSRETGQDNGN